MFTKYFDKIPGGKYTEVVVISDTFPDQRDWIIAAYITGKESDGDIEREKKWQSLMTEQQMYFI